MNLVKTGKSLFISICIFWINLFLVSFLCDNHLFFITDSEFTFRYLDIYKLFSKDMISDWISGLFGIVLMVIIYFKRKNIEEALDYVLIGYTSTKELIIIWIGNFICALIGLANPLVGLFSALITPYLSAITMYYWLKKIK